MLSRRTFLGMGMAALIGGLAQGCSSFTIDYTPRVDYSLSDIAKDTATFDGLPLRTFSTAREELEQIRHYFEEQLVICDGQYEPRDYLGRIGQIALVIGPETVGAEQEASIDEFDPLGWHQAEYPFLNSEVVYVAAPLTDSHFSGLQTDENSIFTATFPALVVHGVLQQEVMRLVDQTGHRYYYQARPLYFGTEIIPRSLFVYMSSADDDGVELSEAYLVPNGQAYVNIDYQTGVTKEDPSVGAEVCEAVKGLTAEDAEFQKSIMNLKYFL